MKRRGYIYMARQELYVLSHGFLAPPLDMVSLMDLVSANLNLWTTFLLTVVSKLCLSVVCVSYLPCFFF